MLATTARSREVKSAGDPAATQKFVDSEFTPLVAAYLKAQDDFVRTLEQRREQVRTDAFNRRVQYAIMGLVMAALLLAVGLAMAWQLVRSITRPLDQAVNAIDAIAAGDLTQELHSTRKDEFGHMLRSLSAMSTQLRGVVTDVRSGVDSVSSASVQIANGNHDLSARTEQTASNLEETAASMEQLTATVTQSADTARQANQLAGTAAQAAARGGEVVGQVVQTMKGINESSQRIADIIGVIDGIAFQTNILALNAAVEAARAGEQGRGFAVVASEVRSLAGRSAEAAKEIKQLISASVERVEQGSAMADQAGETMTEVVQSIRRVTDLMGEINAASSEQASGVAQVGEAVTQMDQATQQNAALVEEMAAAAGSLSSQAQELVQAVAVFKLDAGQSGASAYSTPTARPAPKAAPVRMPAPARKPTAFKAAPAKPAALRAPNPPKPVKTTSAGAEDDWESF